ncbi:MAG: PIG-L family deacetylase [Chthonomonas sp.]|nr:PIG-L family deacetylase [Chthonomonas sp.]
MTNGTVAFDPKPDLRWMFCFAHPDDEVAIAAWMRRLVLNGNPVRCLWLHSTEVREAESRLAMRQIGVPDDALRFWRGTDGSLVDEMGELLPQLDAQVQEFQPDRMAVMAFEQGHLDHDAANYMVSRAFEGVVCEFPMYYAYYRAFQHLNQFAQPDGEERLSLTPEETELKRALPRLFPSQTMARNLFWYNIAQRLIGRNLQLDTRELMRLKLATDYRTPNLPPEIAQKVAASKLWARWLSALDKLAD